MKSLWIGLVVIGQVLLLQTSLFAMTVATTDGAFWVRIPFNPEAGEPVASVDLATSSIELVKSTAEKVQETTPALELITLVLGEKKKTVVSNNTQGAITPIQMIYAAVKPTDPATLARWLQAANRTDRIQLHLYLSWKNATHKTMATVDFYSSLSTAPSSVYALYSAGSQGDFSANQVIVNDTLSARYVENVQMSAQTTELSGNITCDGTIILPAKSASTSLSLPIGAIVLWSSATEIPEGWSLCNGENNTLDLRDRFVMGGNTNEVGQIGGEDSHQLTFSEMPKHEHAMILPITPSAKNGYPNGWADHKSEEQHGYWCNGNRMVSSEMGREGDGKPHENRPPYTALFYIERIF